MHGFRFIHVRFKVYLVSKRGPWPYAPHRIRHQMGHRPDHRACKCQWCNATSRQSVILVVYFFYLVIIISSQLLVAKWQNVGTILICNHRPTSPWWLQIPRYQIGAKPSATAMMACITMINYATQLSSNDKTSSLVQLMALALNRRQAIFWSNVDPVHQRIRSWWENIN